MAVDILAGLAGSSISSRLLRRFTQYPKDCHGDVVKKSVLHTVPGRGGMQSSAAALIHCGTCMRGTVKFSLFLCFDSKLPVLLYRGFSGTVQVKLQCGQMRDSSRCSVRVSTLMDLYIHSLYVLISKILSYILNSFASIHPLYHPLSTLSTVGLTYHFI
jgi:hypothetical protein